MKNLCKHIFGMSLAVSLLTACVDDRNNFMVDDVFTLTAREQLITASVHPGAYTFGVQKSGKGFSAAHAAIALDEASVASAITLYNINNNASLKALPAELFSVSGDQLDYAAEDIVKEVTVTWDSGKVAEFIGDDTDYVIPIRLVSDDLEVNGEKNFLMLRMVRSTLAVSQTSVVRSIEKKAVEVSEENPAPQLQETISMDLVADPALPGIEVEFPVIVDNALIDSFNASLSEENTPYVAAPEGLVRILTPSVTLPADELQTRIQVELDKSVLLQDGILEEFPNYVVPIRIQSEALQASKDGKAFDLQGLVYGNMVTYICVTYATTGISAVTREWGLYSDGGAWYQNLDGFAAGADRTIAMNDDYIFVGHSAATPGIYALSRSNGSFAKKLDIGPAASNGCTFPVSCVRMIPNQSGDDILLFCSLKGDGEQHLYVYAYTNGIDAEPVQILDYLHDVKGGADDWRRYGDRFTVEGTWQDGRLWFHNWSGGSGKTTVFTLKNGIITNADDPVDYLLDNSSGIKDVILYPGSEDVLVTANDKAGIYHNTLTNQLNGWYLWNQTTSLPDFALTYGYNFFKFHGLNYMAYLKMEGANGTKGSLVVIDDGSESPTDFPAQLKAQTNVRTFPIQGETEDAVSSVSAASSVGDCTVRTIGSSTYIAVLMQGCGLSLFQLQ